MPISSPEIVKKMQAQVPIELSGNRLDQALAQLFSDYSRSRLTEWVKSGAVLLDGKVVKPKQLIYAGQSISLTIEDEPMVAMRPEAIDLDIVFEDEHFIVVNKPAGLVVHPGAGNPSGTLQNALLHHDAKLANLPRAGIVHRLDKDTSGVMVVARTLPAHHALVDQLSSREVHRQYVALVNGAVIAGGSVDAPIARHHADRLKMAVVETGKSAISHYRVREKFRAHTLLEVNLETGRTHQIRVHMNHIRHHIVGDPVYGPGLRLPRSAQQTLVDALTAFKRQALHAEVLSFKHPQSGETVSFSAPLPQDFLLLLEAFRADSKAALATK